MEEQKNQITIVKNTESTNYKLVIPKNVEDKIRFHCNNIWNTEWSGILFFNYEGSFEKNNLVIRCLDLFLMDIGNTTYTEFTMSPDVINYMCEHNELLGCQIGLVHSHCTFSTFFSTTDVSTLREEGIDRNNFVSLIVNNEGKYTAAITRKVTSTKKVNNCYSYEFFGDGNVESCKDYEVVEEVIEWFPLTVEKEEAENYDEIKTRLEEVRRCKADQSSDNSKSNLVTMNKSYLGNSYNGLVLPKNIEAKQMELFDKDYTKKINKIKEEEEEELSYGLVNFDENIIKSLATQLITGSILANSDKLDLNKFANSMSSLYSNRFGSTDEGFQCFTAWVESMCEYIVWFSSDPALEELGYGTTEIGAICAYNLIELLQELPQNKYIACIINTLENYIKL